METERMPKTRVNLEGDGTNKFYTFKCKIGAMKGKGKILWLPKSLADYFPEDSYVEIKIRKMQ